MNFPDAPSRPTPARFRAASLFLYVTDVDATFKQAVDAGAKATMPMMDMFWGDRYGNVVDPFGHHWGIATHKEDVTTEEIESRAAAFFAKAAAAATS